MKLPYRKIFHQREYPLHQFDLLNMRLDVSQSLSHLWCPRICHLGIRSNGSKSNLALEIDPLQDKTWKLQNSHLTKDHPTISLLLSFQTTYDRVREDLCWQTIVFLPEMEFHLYTDNLR